MAELNDVGVEDTTGVVFLRRKVAMAERIADLSEKKMEQDKKRDTIAIMMTTSNIWALRTNCHGRDEGRGARRVGETNGVTIGGIICFLLIMLL